MMSQGCDCMILFWKAMWDVDLENVLLDHIVQAL